jgi:glycosyltransferase involved in cell wall biosynthesis
MVHSSFALRGGAERYVRDLSRGLAARGHEVRVFCRASANAEPGDRHVATRLSGRLPVPWSPARKVLTHLGDLVDPTGLRVRDLASFAPDVVHLHNWQGLGILPVARLARAYPTCHTVHDYALCDPNNALGNTGRSGLADRLLRVRSAWLARRLRPTTLLWPARRTRDTAAARVPGAGRLRGHVVPLAVPLPAGAAPPGPRDAFLYLGALSPHKGIDLLLDAWREVHHDVGGTLAVAGDGPLRADVEETARTLPSVRYLGYLDEAGKADALRDAGWLVFPSQWPENFPIACVEALMAGRPLIASTVATPPMASPGSTMLFSGREELATVLVRAARLADGDYGAMAASAAADGRRLDWDSHVDAIVETYGALATAPPSRVAGRPG